MANRDSLYDWMEAQAALSAKAMLRAVSATDLVMKRPSVRQEIHPKPGSILATPETASYDPNPDYFFHWLRDSSIVIDALRVAFEEKLVGPEAVRHFGDFLRFSLDLCRLDGAAFIAAHDFRSTVDPAFLPHVRTERELQEIVGDRVLGETRYNADGTLDLIKWSRPQNDGPALRALTASRLLRLDVSAAFAQEATELLTIDLDYTAKHWSEPCFDLWEEIPAHHYYTRLVQQAALAVGAEFMAEKSDVARARAYRHAAADLLEKLDEHYDAAERHYLAFLADASTPPDIPPARRFDMAVPLGVIHAARSQGPHSVLDPRALETLQKLETFFADAYPINRTRTGPNAPAMGRYPGDVYYSGGAWYLSTLGAAQFYYQLAGALGAGDAHAADPSARIASVSPLQGSPSPTKSFDAALARADMFMDTVRLYTPPSGELSEQFSQIDGAQTSARNLAWSYAAMITAHSSRKAALDQRRS